MPIGEGANPIETHQFQAEVKKVLDIVIHSLYTDREIFVRELISNAFDALEKFRHESLMHKEVFDGHLSLEILINMDERAHTLTIIDTGVGMTHEELISNLGSIAHSGSQSFLAQLAEAARKDVDLIGQFGVGFYSAFMASDRVRVQTRGFRPDDQGWEWVSDGSGTYTIEPAKGLRRGTTITLELKEDAYEFANPENIKQIIKRYSNFVPFPILVKGERVNTIQAIWTRNKNEIKEEEYTEFYKFIANAFDEPSYYIHFSADAPLAIHALLFVPRENFEGFGFGRMEPGVDLYCRKVMIDKHPEGLLPEWMRFLRGVIDSEDLPLNISRETLQDNSIVRKVNQVISGRFLKFLEEEAKQNPEKFTRFWNTFGIFLKEGIVNDFAHQKEIARLLRFESSKTEKGKLTSLTEYLGRMKEEQKVIYYLNGPSREIIEGGPYLEAFRSRDLEVIYTHDPIDDFVMSNVHEFEGKKMLSADQANLELPEAGKPEAGKKEEKGPEEKQEQEREQRFKESLSADQIKSLTGWLKEILGERVKDVVESHRLVESPAIVVNLDSGMSSAMRRVMRAMDGKAAEGIANLTMEINPHHPLIRKLDDMRRQDEGFAKIIGEQVFDNAMIAAGLLAEPRNMVDRMYRILEKAME
jgi:TNF receptor-associated protein 1